MADELAQNAPSLYGNNYDPGDAVSPCLRGTVRATRAVANGLEDWVTVAVPMAALTAFRPDIAAKLAKPMLAAAVAKFAVDPPKTNTDWIRLAASLGMGGATARLGVRPASGQPPPARTTLAARANATDQPGSGGAPGPTPGVGGGTPATTRVFRVEGVGNQRIVIDENGNVTVPRVLRRGGQERNLYLNFGDEARAQNFLAQRLAQFPDNQVKSFDVPTSFLESLRENAVREVERAKFPDKPVIADPTKAADQFGLPAGWIDQLIDAIVPGSGSTGASGGGAGPPA